MASKKKRKAENKFENTITALLKESRDAARRSSIDAGIATKNAAKAMGLSESALSEVRELRDRLQRREVGYWVKRIFRWLRRLLRQ